MPYLQGFINVVCFEYWYYIYTSKPILFIPFEALIQILYYNKHTWMYNINWEKDERNDKRWGTCTEECMVLASCKQRVWCWIIIIIKNKNKTWLITFPDYWKANFLVINNDLLFDFRISKYHLHKCEQNIIHLCLNTLRIQ